MAENVPSQYPDLPSPEILKEVLVTGDLMKLTPEQCVEYTLSVCKRLGLNPLTQPFAFIILNGKKVLYPKRDATDQLRRVYGISLKILSEKVEAGIYKTKVLAKMPNGREDEDIGTVPLHGLQGEALSNALMKGVTKAKRRVTLSICGLGMNDELEWDSVPGATKEEIRIPHDPETGEVTPAAKEAVRAVAEIHKATQEAEHYPDDDQGSIADEIPDEEDEDIGLPDTPPPPPPPRADIKWIPTKYDDPKKGLKKGDAIVWNRLTRETWHGAAADRKAEEERLETRQQAIARFEREKQRNG